MTSSNPGATFCSCCPMEKSSNASGARDSFLNPPFAFVFEGSPRSGGRRRASHCLTAWSRQWLACAVCRKKTVLGMIKWCVIKDPWGLQSNSNTSNLNYCFCYAHHKKKKKYMHICLCWIYYMADWKSFLRLNILVRLCPCNKYRNRRKPLVFISR